MTYQEFLEQFIETDKQMLEYQQEDCFLRVVKIQLTKGVYALYAAEAYLGCSTSAYRYRFDPNEAMELAGYIDCNGNIRFPTQVFFGLIEDAENGPQPESVKTVLENELLKTAKKLAMEKPLPAITDDDSQSYAYKIARRQVFNGTTYNKEFPTSNFDKYTCDPDCLVDYLANTPGWCEKAVKAWAQDNNRTEMSPLEEFREGLAFIKEVKTCEDRIRQDRTLNLYRYIDMKNAVQEVKTVTVVFKTVTGSIDKAKVHASAFCDSFYWDRVCLLDVVPRKDMERVFNLMPAPEADNFRDGVKVGFMSKADIIAIQYNGKTLWAAEEKNCS